jgi:hypothetical protein
MNDNPASGKQAARQGKARLTGEARPEASSVAAGSREAFNARQSLSSGEK